jgi:hypothetical protein
MPSADIWMVKTSSLVVGDANCPYDLNEIRYPAPQDHLHEQKRRRASKHPEGWRENRVAKKTENLPCNYVKQSTSCGYR